VNGPGLGITKNKSSPLLCSWSKIVLDSPRRRGHKVGHKNDRVSGSLNIIVGEVHADLGILGHDLVQLVIQSASNNEFTGIADFKYGIKLFNLNSRTEAGTKDNAVIRRVDTAFLDQFFESFNSDLVSVYSLLLVRAALLLSLG